MHDDIEFEADTTRSRPVKLNRKRSARPSEITSKRRVTSIKHSFGGRHQRRNKRWEW